MAHISIYLTNLGKYNEGELIGEWVELPVSDEELQAVFDRIGIDDYYEEYFITDYESDIPGLYIDEYENISYLNELAEKYANLSDWDLKVFSNASEAGFVNKEDIDDFDSSRFILYQDAYDARNLGYAMIDMFGGLETFANETLQDNFDFEAYGRDFRLQWTPSNWIDNVEDDADINIYDYFGVSDDKELGEYVAYDIDGGLQNLDKDTLETYFDYEGYAENIINSGVGAFTEDGFIEDTER